MAVPNSQKDCAFTTGCAKPGANANLPLNHDVIAPWVMVKFLSASPPMEITVGNETSKHPIKNLQVIKSFQYGFVSGTTNGSFECNVEVIDAQGGEFDRFVQKVFPKNSDPGEYAKEFKMEFQFGWTFTDCMRPGNAKTLAWGGDDVYISKPKYALPNLVETKYDQNLVKFMIKGSSPVDQLLNMGTERINYGNKFEGIRLKSAIRELFRPHKIEVLFMRRESRNGFGPNIKKRLAGVDPLDPDSFLPAIGPGMTAGEIAEFERQIFGNIQMGGAEEWGFPPNHGGFEGPLGIWEPKNRDPVESAMDWLRTTRTDRHRGIVIGVANPKPERPIVIFWESPMPDCNGVFPFQQQPLGFYFVNAGKCSPVIEFKPSIKWNAAVVNKGGNSSTESGRPIEASDDCDFSGEGTADALQPPDWAKWYFGGAASAEMAKSAAAHSRANLTGFDAIEAELVCQGDARFYDPMMVTGRTLGLVVVNPFGLLPKKGGGLCGGFGQLAGGRINDFFSHEGWMLLGVDHQIKEGSFVTTYKILMAVPGKTINRTAKAGAGPCAIRLPPTGAPGGP